MRSWAKITGEKTQNGGALKEVEVVDHSPEGQSTLH
jgi:hypothetical protein